MWVIAVALGFCIGFIAWAIWFAKGLINTGVYGLLGLVTGVILYSIYSIIGFNGLMILGAILFVWLSISAGQDQ